MGSSKDGKPNPENLLMDGVSATVGSFANRIKRKIKEQADQDAESQRLSASRHTLMLQAIALCRKALQETSKIPLGSRFSLNLEITDFESWPRLELALIDNLSPENRDCCLLVTAHDRKELGTITFALRSGEVLQRVHLSNEGETARLPLVMKKSVRSFLDIVSAAVLEKQRKAEHQEPEIPEALDKELETPELQQNLDNQNLFAEESAITDRNVIDAEDGDTTPLLIVSEE